MPRKKKQVPLAQQFVRDVPGRDDASPKERELLARLEKLEAERDRLLGQKQASDQTIAALQSAQNQQAMVGGNTEVPTGEKVKIKVFDKYETIGYKENGEERLRPKFKTVEVPTYYYKIEMPPCGDTSLGINGDRLYHGKVYELDMNTLRTVKDIVWRTWTHDRSIHPGDENFYRRDQAWIQRNSAALSKGLH